MTTTASSATGTRGVTPALLAARVLAAASLAVLVGLYGTAGVLVADGGSPDVHGTAAVVLHVVSGLAVLAFAWLWRTTGGPWWPTALAVGVFAAGFGQALVADVLTLHVPGALVVTAAAVWLTAWSFSAGAAARS